MGRPNSVFNEREQTEFHVCKAVEDNPYMESRKSNVVEFESAQVESTDLTEIIEEDKIKPQVKIEKEQVEEDS